MTPLQALNYLYEEASFGTLDNSKNTECLMLLTSLVTPPTADDVCEAILNDIDFGCEFKDGIFYFLDGSEMVKLNDKGGLQFYCYPNPRTLSLIARFYEGVD